ncbi:arylsulfatase B-like [Littorina saxatilis]|uniref:arylsulfatase B-like n=1 Tax=Littorina saxatilis TaxID=31220 RepID=UPI0038B598FC
MSGSHCYLTGAKDYLTHNRSGFLDLHDNLDPVFNETGHYSAQLFTQKASDVIMAHDSTKSPLFLYLAYQSVHGPLEVPEHYKEQYRDIKDTKRRTYAGMVTCMDEGIGNLTSALKTAGLWDNTVFIFSTDNGGQIYEGGNNYPLRGWKGSLWEGGLHGVGFVHSPLLHKQGYVNRALIHVSDWFPTIVGLARGSLNGTLPLDGFDQWRTISEDAPSPRKELLHNIDILYGRSGSPRYPDTFDTRIRAALRVGDYKLITGYPGNPSEHLNVLFSWIPPPELQDLRDTTDASTGKSANHPDSDHRLLFRPSDQNVWLFNITADPEERHDLSDSLPEVVQQLLSRLLYYNSTVVPPRFPKEDPNASPGKHGGVWGPWE